MIPLLLVLAWIVIGASVGFYEARRGHWRWLWLLGAIAGPVAIPLARLTNWQEPFIAPNVVGESDRIGHPGVQAVVGIDGSADSRAAARHVADLFGPQLGQLTLATVVDFETADLDTAGTLGSTASAERAETEATLRKAADELAEWLAWRPGTVLLAGKPSVALQAYSRESGADVLAIGRRGRGLAKHLLGSCASELARRSSVPVVVVPVGGTSGAESGSSAAGHLARH